ncbi:MAG: energy-coupling factor transporter transmembrane component T [Roseiflexaceae bacterium]
MTHAPDQRTGLYLSNHGQMSPIHRLHPTTKLMIALVVVAAAFLIPGLATPLLIFVVVLVPLAAIAQVLWPFVRGVVLVILPVAISLVLVQGFFFPTPNPTLIPIGPVNLRQEGLIFAIQTAGRLLVVAGAPLLVLQTTHPMQLIQALTEAGLPRSAGYIVLVTLQLIPAVQERAAAVADAQRARGLETEGNILVRVRSLLPLVSPLVVGLLLESEERALALESRAFLAPGPKSSLYDLADTTAERWFRWGCLGVVLILIAWRVLGALNGTGAA